MTCSPKKNVSRTKVRVRVRIAKKKMGVAKIAIVRTIKGEDEDGVQRRDDALVSRGHGL